MAARTTLNAKNLEKLGPGRLAGLLMEVLDGNAEGKRRARLELAAAAGPAVASKFIGGRLAAIEKMRSHVSVDRGIALAREMDAHRITIAEHVAKHQPELGVLLRLQLLGALLSVQVRGGGWFDLRMLAKLAVVDLAASAKIASTDSVDVAEHISGLIVADYDHLLSGIVEAVVPSLDEMGVSHLKDKLWATHREIAKGDRRTKKKGRRPRSIAIPALRSVAVVEGDADSYIALSCGFGEDYPAEAAIDIRHFVETAGAETALRVLESTGRSKPYDEGGLDLVDAELLALDSAGRHAEAQALRMTTFKSAYSAQHLRDYLRNLPEFDDIEEEDRALESVAQSGEPMAAFRLLVEWPSFDRAAAVARRSHGDFSTTDWMWESQNMTKFEKKYPLEATLVHRAHLNAYKTSSFWLDPITPADLLGRCKTLSDSIKDFGPHDTHAKFVRYLKQKWHREYIFWRIYKDTYGG